LVKVIDEVVGLGHNSKVFSTVSSMGVGKHVLLQ